MRKASLVHPSLNKMGGAEKILLETLKLLNDEGYETTLYTIDSVKWGLLESKWGVETRPSREVSYLGEANPSNVLDWTASAIIYLWMLWRAQQDPGISLNNYGEVFPFFFYISYVHSKPLVSNAVNSFNLPLWPHSWRAYRYLFDLLFRRLSPLLVANSGYTAGIIEEQGLDSKVVYPFIEPIKLKAYKKGDVLTISRISWGKNLDTLFNVAAKCRGVRFKIAGTVSKNALDLVKEIKRSKKFSFHANPSRQEIEGYMAESSVYFSTQPNETFGMAILEAMSAGCVPLVFRGGGPWHDILGEEENSGLSYLNEDEAVEKVRKVMREEGLRNKLRAAAIERSKDFNKERFRAEILEVINSVEPRERKEGRLVNLCRWIDEKREEFGF